VPAAEGVFIGTFHQTASLFGTGSRIKPENHKSFEGNLPSVAAGQKL